MKMTIEQYIEQCFVMRKASDLDLINKLESDLKYYIKLMHMEVSRRMRFSLPIHLVNAYNIDSYIIPLNASDDYHHIIDISMFGYFEELLAALEFDMPNYAVFIYRKMRRDICLSRYNKEEALRYNPEAVYITEHNMKVNLLMREYSENQQEKYKCMIRFYFLHEYMHYLIANPAREATNDLTDMIVEILFENLAKESNSNFIDKKIQEEVLKNYRDEWNNNLGFREEIYCDFQAIMCLLELPGIYNKVSVELILDGIMSFMYIQHIIWLSKHIEEPLQKGNQFSFRQNLIAIFAWLMEENDFSEVVSKLLQHSNKFFVPTRLQVNTMWWGKQQRFFNCFVEILRADRNREIKSEKYVFPVFSNYHNEP